MLLDSGMGLTTSTKNSQACEVCGGLSEDRFARNSTAIHSGYRYVRTRSNRTRIDPLWWDGSCGGYQSRLEAAGMTAELWAGKLVCVDCQHRFCKVVNS